MKYTCPCCGYISLDSEIHDICDICNWQDEPVSRTEPDFEGGVNGNVTLRQAQSNFAEFGACEKAFLKVVRKPNEQDKRDPKWKPLKNKKE
ncbi:CPCC family cysteine-rich protein [Bacillus sp. CGMCC 1.16541]|uniref:CPCC family cysteine-rich protein n=1 Tax=Bacillus sp. CGMCC 1.16541 TaxID=2185143 RepID=UPI000D725912|nr:CPCC family cysteine-rich protein [Bacillus sp. CGMCC 1.16541]